MTKTRRMSSPTLAIVVAMFALALQAAAQGEFVRSWDAGQLFREGRSSSVILDAGKMTLENDMLIEDDAPGCGYSANPAAIEILRDGIVLKKMLILERLPVRGASVVAMFYPDNPTQPNNGRHVVFTVNGTDIPYEIRHFWTHAPVPAHILKKGENTILVRTLEPDTRFKTWIALEENFRIGSLTRTHHPNRSARSTDGGKTWDDQHLGVNASVDGEYSIRLALDAYQPEGWVESPVVDLAANANLDVMQVPVEIADVMLEVTRELPAHTTLDLETRSGSSLLPEAGGWSEWRSSQGVTPKSALQGRFFQFRLLCRSASADASPAIRGVRLRSTYTIPPGHMLSEFHSVTSHHPEVIRSSFPFAYENPHLDRLQQFRARMKLDDVVADARTEFEKMLRIKGWVARQWNWHLLKPEEDIIEWDAGTIMTPGPDGTIEGGFCLHYAIVLMQALQSFGFPARIVSVDYSVWGGHEVVEAWSNQFGKWIFLDANFDTYFADQATGVPMNVLEMHDLFLKHYFAGRVIDRDSWSREDLAKMARDAGKPSAVIGVLGGNARTKTLKTYEWWNPPVEQTPYCGGYGPLVMGYLRYMPRANYLSEPLPIPVNHGRTHWGWTGYTCWYDQQTPRSLEHTTFTSRATDLYWNLNQVDFRAVVVKSGLLKIDMVTNAPDFKEYEVLVNGEVMRTKSPVFEMRMERGLNRVEMRVTDSMGNRGAASMLECIFIPKAEEN
jgi:hypothetical protein